MKLGLNALKYDLKAHQRMGIMRAALDQFGPAPLMSPGYSALVEKLIGGDWQMEGNDTVGDCTCADVAHRHMLWTAQSGTMWVPTTLNTLTLYEQATGYDPSQTDAKGNNPTDQGGTLTDIAQYVQDHGFAGHTEAGHGIIDPSNLDHIKWAVVLFGCCSFGLELPASAQTQFERGEPWDVVAGASIEGGHDVLAVEYQPDEPCWQLISWGKRISATSAFVNKFLFNVVPTVSADFINPAGIAPSGINLDRMLTDLQGLN